MRPMLLCTPILFLLLSCGQEKSVPPVEPYSSPPDYFILNYENEGIRYSYAPCYMNRDSASPISTGTFSTIHRGDSTSVRFYATLSELSLEEAPWWSCENRSVTFEIDYRDRKQDTPFSAYTVANRLRGLKQSSSSEGPYLIIEVKRGCESFSSTTLRAAVDDLLPVYYNNPAFEYEITEAEVLFPREQCDANTFASLIRIKGSFSGTLYSEFDQPDTDTLAVDCPEFELYLKYD